MNKTFFKKPKALTPQKIRKKWVSANLKLWSLIIRHRDKYLCQWCGSVKLPQAHHIVARSITQHCKNAWFVIENGVTLCHKCHFYRLKSCPDEYIEWRDKWMSKNCSSTYKELRLVFSAKTKTRLDHLIIINQDLKNTCSDRHIKM